MEIQEIYERYKKLLTDIALRIVKNESDAEDIIQTAFLRLAQKHINNDKQALSYLIKTVVGRAKNKKYRNISFRMEETVVSNSDPEGQILNQELKDVVRNAIERLPYKEKVVLIMKKYEGFSHKEISKIMHMREGAVRVLLYRGMRKLEKMLMPYISGGKDEKRDEN